MTIKNYIHDADICDVLSHIYGVDQDDTDVMDWVDLYVNEKGISPYEFASELIKKLLPLADVAQKRDAPSPCWNVSSLISRCQKVTTLLNWI